MHTPGKPHPDDPPPSRRFLWRATYENDVTITEVVDDACGGIGFQDLPREGMARFAIVEAATGREAVGFHLADGHVDLLGQCLDLRLGDVALTGRVPVPPDTIRQYKVAHAERQGDGTSSGTVLDAHVVGYAVELPEGALELLVELDPRTGHSAVAVLFSPPPGAPPACGAVTAVLGGRPVEALRAFVPRHGQEDGG